MGLDDSNGPERSVAMAPRRDFASLLPGRTVIPVIQIAAADDAVPLAEALVSGGLEVLEVTLRTDVAIEAADRMIREVPQAIVGIGTVTRPEELKKVLDLGARFAVSPGLTPALAEAASATGLPYLPGASTPSEVMLARSYGFFEMKFYPAVLAGGPAAVRNMASLFPDVSFCPTGGIAVGNLAEFLKLENVFSVGGTWVAPPKLIAERKWRQISGLAREAADIANAASVTG